MRLASKQAQVLCGRSAGWPIKRQLVLDSAERAQSPTCGEGGPTAAASLEECRPHSSGCCRPAGRWWWQFPLKCLHGSSLSAPASEPKTRQESFLSLQPVWFLCYQEAKLNVGVLTSQCLHLDVVTGELEAVFPLLHPLAGGGGGLRCERMEWGLEKSRGLAGSFGRNG